MSNAIGQFFVDPADIPHTFPGFVQLCFLGAVYGYVLCYGSNMISDGSELLLLIPSLAGIVGSIVLPILGAVPDGAIVIFSGLGNDAQKQVSVGVGALAGSTIMLLTVPWLLAVVAGRVGMVDGVPQYTKPKGWPRGTKWAKITDQTKFLNTGVSCGPTIRKSAFLMVATLIPYLVIQIPSVFKKCTMESEKNDCQTPKWASIVGAVIATLFFIFYLWFQVKMANADDEEVKEEKIDEIRKNALKRNLVSIRGLFFSQINEDGVSGTTRSGSYVNFDVNDERFRKIVKSFFNEFDLDGNGTIDQAEFLVLLHRLGEKPTADQLDDLMCVADADGDGVISFDEFCVAIARMTEDGFIERTIRGDNKESAEIEAAKDAMGGGGYRHTQHNNACDDECAGGDDKLPLLNTVNADADADADAFRRERASRGTQRTSMWTEGGEEGEEGGGGISRFRESRKVRHSRAVQRASLAAKQLAGEGGGDRPVVVAMGGGGGGALATENSTAVSATDGTENEKSDDGEDGEDDDSDEEPEIPEDLAHLSPAEQQKRILLRSFLLMGVGVFAVLLFSDPMVDVLTQLGEHTGINPFYVAFVLAPLASNASEVIAAYAYALKKTEKTMTISFSSLIGAACMNNTFCLSLFLYLIYFKDLEWTFTSETIAIVAIELVMFFVAIRRVHPTWTAFAVGALFFVAIGLVVGLEATGLD